MSCLAYRALSRREARALIGEAKCSVCMRWVDKIRVHDPHDVVHTLQDSVRAVYVPQGLGVWGAMGHLSVFNDLLVLHLQCLQETGCAGSRA